MRELLYQSRREAAQHLAQVEKLRDQSRIETVDEPEDQLTELLLLKTSHLEEELEEVRGEDMLEEGLGPLWGCDHFLGGLVRGLIEEMQKCKELLVRVQGIACRVLGQI